MVTELEGKSYLPDFLCQHERNSLQPGKGRKQGTEGGRETKEGGEGRRKKEKRPRMKSPILKEEGEGKELRNGAAIFCYNHSMSVNRGFYSIACACSRSVIVIKN